MDYRCIAHTRIVKNERLTPVRPYSIYLLVASLRRSNFVFVKPVQRNLNLYYRNDMTLGWSRSTGEFFLGI